MAYAITTSQCLPNVVYRYLERGPFVLPVFKVTPGTVLAIIASVFYLLAGWRRHKYVFGRTLGGSGVEQLDLTIPGYEPEYEAISSEGRILLV